MGILFHIHSSGGRNMTWLSASVSTSKTTARALIKIYMFFFFLCMVTNKKGFGCFSLVQLTKVWDLKITNYCIKNEEQWGFHTTVTSAFTVSRTLSLFSLFSFFRLCVVTSLGSRWSHRKALCDWLTGGFLFWSTAVVLDTCLCEQNKTGPLWLRRTVHSNRD